MEYICNLCNKNYSSYQSLWNHNKKFHQEIKKNNCEYCNKIFSQKSSLNRHYKNCNYKIKYDNKIKGDNDNKLKQENELLKRKLELCSNDVEMLKKQILELMNNNCKVHPKTLTKINKQLNNNNINNGTINNINNNVIIQLGNEALSEFLTNKQKIKFLNDKHNCLDNLVKFIHFNDDYPQFKNILITNMKDDLAYKFDSNQNKFIAIEKNILMHDIIYERMCDITLFYEELIDQLDPKTKKVIETIIDKMDNDEKFINEKKKGIKLIIYNNRDKVSKEITHDLEIIV